MEANTIIKLNGKNYLLTQQAIVNGSNYYMACEVDDGNIIKQKYGIFRERINEKGETLFSLVQDEKEKIAVYKLFIEDVIREMETDPNFLSVGSIVNMKRRQFALIDYIPYEAELFAIFTTLDKPLDIVVARRDVDKDGKVHYIDVTTSDDGVAVIQIHAQITLEDENSEN